MRKTYFTALLLLALNMANAKANAVIDSIGVENNNGKKLIIHKTEAKETYYAIGRRYNVAAKDIMAFNDNKALKIGVIIKVPTNIPFGTSNAAPAPVNSSVHDYIVKPKDNLNVIAEKFGTTVNEIKTLNNLTGNNLSIGQSLKIPSSKTVQQPASLPEKPNTQKTDNQNSTATLIEYTVKPREFLNRIAETFGTTAEEIKKANNLSSSNLHIGQVLKIPATKNINPDQDVITTVPKQGADQEKTKDSPGTHTVKNGETIFNIAQQYGITAYQIRKINNLNDNEITVGQTLKIPSNIIVDIPVVKEKPVEVPLKTSPASNSKDDHITHTVIKGETIFSIAQKYGLTAYQIRVANRLSDNTLAIDQKLTIPKAPQPKSVNDLSKLDQEENPDSTTLKNPKLHGDPSRYGLSQIEEKGTAVWIADPDLDSSKMLVLHRTAPIGRVIKITNPMTNRTALAKVVGKFTENESTKDVIIVMTKAVADSLGALDKRFFCNLTYSAQ